MSAEGFPNLLEPNGKLGADYQIRMIYVFFAQLENIALALHFQI